jgi:hypothetical protein
VDGLLWLSPLLAKAPDWKTEIPTVAITQPGAIFSRQPDVLIETSLPGQDAPSAIFSSRYQAIMPSAPLPDAPHPAPSKILETLLGHMEAQAA